MAFETLYMNFLSPKAPYPHFKDWPEWLPKTSHAIEEILDNAEYRAELEKLKNTVTMVIGGPPCQGFSVGGARRGHDVRNQLVYRLLETVKIVRPPIVVIENVEGITKMFVAKPGNFVESVADSIVRRLDELGYTSGLCTVDVTEFGVPQTRKRVLFLGVSKELTNLPELSPLLKATLAKASVELRETLGLPLERPVNVDEALHDLAGTDYLTCPDSPKFQSAYYLSPRSTFAKLMRKSVKSNVPNSHRFSEHGEKVKGLYELAHATQKPGRLSKTFLSNNNTKTNKKFLLDASRPASTLTTHPDEHIHYLHPRNVSIREMARIQSFPDNFWFYGRYTLNGDRRGLDVSRCAQVGNAIPPLLGQGLGITLSNLIDKIISEDSDLAATAQTVAVQQSLFAESLVAL